MVPRGLDWLPCSSLCLLCFLPTGFMFHGVTTICHQCLLVARPVFFQMVIIITTKMNIPAYLLMLVTILFFKMGLSPSPPPTPSVGTGQPGQPLSMVPAAWPCCGQGYPPSSTALSSVTSFSVSHVPSELDSLSAFPRGPACCPTPSPYF